MVCELAWNQFKTYEATRHGHRHGKTSKLKE